jgi:hypothetical protein
MTARASRAGRHHHGWRPAVRGDDNGQGRPRSAAPLEHRPGGGHCQHHQRAAGGPPGHGGAGPQQSRRLQLWPPAGPGAGGQQRRAEPQGWVGGDGWEGEDDEKDKGEEEEGQEEDWCSALLACRLAAAAGQAQAAPRLAAAGLAPLIPAATRTTRVAPPSGPSPSPCTCCCPARHAGAGVARDLPAGLRRAQRDHAARRRRVQRYPRHSQLWRHHQVWWPGPDCGWGWGEVPRAAIATLMLPAVCGCDGGPSHAFPCR